MINRHFVVGKILSLLQCMDCFVVFYHFFCEMTFSVKVLKIKTNKKITTIKQIWSEKCYIITEYYLQQNGRLIILYSICCRVNSYQRPFWCTYSAEILTHQLHLYITQKSRTQSIFASSVLGELNGEMIKYYIILITIWMQWYCIWKKKYKSNSSQIYNVSNCT